MAAKSSASDKIKVGVIGVGIGRTHLNAYKKLPNVQIEAICDINETRGETAAKDFGVEKFYTDYKKMLAKSGIDAVSVCVPNHLHAELAVAAAEAGKHVLCEKPMADTLANGEKIVKAARKAEKNGQVFMMAMNNRYRGDSQVLKAFIDNGDLGEIYHAKCGWIRRNGIPGFGGWFTTKEKSGGGPLIDIGVHVLDLTLYFMGNPKPVSATGATYAKFGPEGKGTWNWGAPPDSSTKTFDVEDFASGFVKFDNGATLAIEASWASYIKEDRFYSNILGTEGGADLEPLTIYKNMNGTPVDIKPQFPQLAGHEAEIVHFIDCITGGKQPISTAEQGLHILQILDAIYRSSQSGKEVVIER
ncbi:MAG TPA: Gfo/Idh/MocA family oxidoreductase [Capsulimonadaceae bacterium]|jgi:predicted dehydrogenase